MLVVLLLERPNSGDLGGPDAGRGLGAVIRDGVGTAHSSLTLTAAPSTIPTGGLDTNNSAIKPSSKAEEIEKTTAKEIKRCLFSHGYHQTVSMNNIDAFKYGNFSGQDTATRTSQDQAIKDQLHASAFMIAFTIYNYIKKTDIKQTYRHMSVTYIFINKRQSTKKPQTVIQQSL